MSDVEREGEVPGREIEVTVNGVRRRARVEDRQLLVEALRGPLGLTGTHVGCANGDCGACTVRVDGEIAKSCLRLAASADGAEITTIEGFAPEPGELTDLQQAFWDHDAFQCGFCVAGHLFALEDLLEREPDPSEDEVRQALIGNLCRCTGYASLVKATLQVAAERRVRN
jgi:aerobic-type carbon monoxide dehydrogenase small subunit (CoxS/CutS family)